MTHRDSRSAFEPPTSDPEALLSVTTCKKKKLSLELISKAQTHTLCTTHRLWITHTQTQTHTHTHTHTPVCTPTQTVGWTKLLTQHTTLPFALGKGEASSAISSLTTLHTRQRQGKVNPHHRCHIHEVFGKQLTIIATMVSMVPTREG